MSEFPNTDAVIITRQSPVKDESLAFDAPWRGLVKESNFAILTGELLAERVANFEVRTGQSVELPRWAEYTDEPLRFVRHIRTGRVYVLCCLDMEVEQSDGTKRSYCNYRGSSKYITKSGKQLSKAEVGKYLLPDNRSFDSPRLTLPLDTITDAYDWQEPVYVVDDDEDESMDLPF